MTASPVYPQNLNSFIIVLEKIDTLSMDVTPSSKELETIFNEIGNLSPILESTKKEIKEKIESFHEIEETIVTIQIENEKNENKIAECNKKIQSIQENIELVNQKLVPEKTKLENLKKEKNAEISDEEKIIGDLVTKKNQRIEQENKSIEDLINQKVSIYNELPEVDFFIDQLISFGTYSCIESNTGYKFILRTFQELKPKVIGNRGYLTLRLHYLGQESFENVLGNLLWFDVYEPASSSELFALESRIKKVDSTITKKKSELEKLEGILEEEIQAKRKSVDAISAQCDQLIREQEMVVSNYENQIQSLNDEIQSLKKEITVSNAQYQDNYSKMNTLQESKNLLFGQWLNGIYSAGYELILFPSLGNDLKGFLLNKPKELKNNKEHFQLLDQRFLFLSELAHTITFQKSLQSSDMVNVTFHDNLSSEIREMLRKRAVKHSILNNSSFLIEKYIYNKWKDIATIRFPLVGQKVPLKYVPTKLRDEYRIKSSLFSEIEKDFTYEHDVETIPEKSYSNQEISPSSTPTPALPSPSPLLADVSQTPSPSTMPSSVRQLYVTMICQKEASYGTDYPITFEFSRTIPQGFLLIDINNDRSIEGKYNLESLTLQTILVFKTFGIVPIKIQVVEGNTIFYEKLLEVNVNQIAGVKFRQSSDGFLSEPVREIFSILEILQIPLSNSNGYQTVTLFNTPIIIGVNGQCTYLGALYLSREMALHYGLPSAYNDYLKPTGIGIAIGTPEIAQTLDEPVWTEGYYDYRGDSIEDVRFKQFENRKRSMTELIQAKVLSKNGETLLPVNSDKPGMAGFVFFIPEEILENKVEIK